MKLSKLSTLALAAVLAGSLAACNAPEAVKAAAPVEPAKPAVDTAKIAAAVKAVAAQLVADFNAKDAAKAVSHDEAGYVGMFHGAPNTVGPEADLAMTKMQVSDPNVKLTIADATVDVAASGEMAVYRTTYAYVSTDPKTKKPTTENGNWLLGYKAQADGSWKLAWGVVSDTGPAAPPAAPATTKPK